MSRRTIHNPERIATQARTTTTTSRRTGVRNCACRDCFELTYASEAPALCHDCEAAGCDLTAECQSPNAYGGHQ